MALTKSGGFRSVGSNSVNATCAKNLNGPQTDGLNIPEIHPFIGNIKTFLREKAVGFKTVKWTSNCRDIWRAVPDGKCGLAV